MKPTNHKSGYALVTVIGILTVFSILLTMLLKVNKQTIFTGKFIRNRAKAVAYAEAGIEYAYSVLREDFDNRTNPASFLMDSNSTYTAGSVVLNDYGEGSFALRLTPLSNGQYVVVNSLGTCEEATAEAEVLVEDSHYQDPNLNDNYDEMEAFSKAVASGGSAKIGGGGAAIGNPEIAIHSNDGVVIAGNIEVQVSISSTVGIDLKNKTINGSATAPDVDPGGAQGSASGGVYEEAVPAVSTPEINLTPFYNEAMANGQVYIGDQQFKNDYEIPGGVLFVDGDIKIYANITGTVIATGDITILNGGVTESGYGIAAATDTGNITDNSTGNGQGLFYSRTGDFSQGASSGRITGQIIVGGNVDKTGGKELVFQVFLPDPPDDDSDYLEANPVISAWQK